MLVSFCFIFSLVATEGDYKTLVCLFVCSNFIWTLEQQYITKHSYIPGVVY